MILFSARGVAKIDATMSAEKKSGLDSERQVVVGIIAGRNETWESPTRKNHHYTYSFGKRQEKDDNYASFVFLMVGQERSTMSPPHKLLF